MFYLRSFDGLSIVALMCCAVVGCYDAHGLPANAVAPDAAVRFPDAAVRFPDAAVPFPDAFPIDGDLAYPTGPCDLSSVGVIETASSREELIDRIRGNWEACDGRFAERSATRVTFEDDDRDGMGIVRAWDGDLLVIERGYLVDSFDRAYWNCSENPCFHISYAKVSRDGGWLLDDYFDDDALFRRVH